MKGGENRLVDFNAIEMVNPYAGIHDKHGYFTFALDMFDGNACNLHSVQDNCRH